jgi:hypothetical protein
MWNSSFWIQELFGTSLSLLKNKGINWEARKSRTNHPNDDPNHSSSTSPPPSRKHHEASLPTAHTKLQTTTLKASLPEN